MTNTKFNFLPGDLVSYADVNATVIENFGEFGTVKTEEGYVEDWDWELDGIETKLENVQTTADVKREFLKDLGILLNKYSTPDNQADLEVLEGDGYIFIPGVWDSEGNCLRETCSINFGKWFDRDNAYE